MRSLVPVEKNRKSQIVMKVYQNVAFEGKTAQSANKITRSESTTELKKRKETRISFTLHSIVWLHQSFRSCGEAHLSLPLCVNDE